MDDYYAILGLDPGASRESIKIAFRRRARETHPDFQTSSSAIEKEDQSRRMAQLNEAYAVLYEVNRRRAYDEQLRMQAALPSKQTTATSEKPTATATRVAHRIRTRPEVDSSLVFEFSGQLRANIRTKFGGFSWKDREAEGFDWGLEASSWSSHSWIILRALPSVQTSSAKSFLTYAEVAITRNHSSLRKDYFLFLLAFQQMHDWDAISLQCRRFLTGDARAGSSSPQVGMLFLDVQRGRALRFETQAEGKLHQMIDWVATHI